MAERKRRRLTNLAVKAISLVSLGANQPAKVALYKSADVPASESDSDPADTKTSTATLTEVTDILASALTAAVSKINLPAAPAKHEETMTATTTPATVAAVVDKPAETVAVDKTAELEAMVKSLNEKITTSEAEKVAAVAKAAEQATELAKRDEAVAKAQRETLLTKTVADVTKTYKAIPKIKFDELALKVVELREAKPELATYFETALKSANDAIDASSLFRTAGVVGKSEDITTAEQEYESLVAKTMAEGKLSRGAAALKVLETPEGRQAYSDLSKPDSK